MEQRLGLGRRLALDGRGHEGCRRLRNRAARALESDLADHVAVEPHVERDVVAAQGVVALGRAVGVPQLLEVPRAAVVLEDGCLVQLAQVGHQANRARTLATAAARASASRLVFYKAKDARALA